jgi:hypothetical protein
MHNQQLREQLAAELRRQKLPETYIERLLEELDDHFVDLHDERDANMQKARMPEAVTADANAESANSSLINLAARLGDPKSLGELAAKQYYSRSFLGRHPILTFLVLPLPLVCVQIIAIGLLMFIPNLVMTWLNIDLGDGFNTPPPLAESLILALLSWLLVVGPPLAAGLLLCSIARKNQLDWRWAAVACALIAVHCALFFISSQLKVAPAEGLFVIGFDLATSAHWIFGRFLPKFSIALAIGGLLILRSRRLQGASSGSEDEPQLRAAA